MKKNIKRYNQAGFTLVELAIVIVIIGFIVAGIAAGSSLIRQAQLRSVITDFNNYVVAYNNFLGRYNAVPGDFSKGSSFWPDTATTSTKACTFAATSDPCDGDGDGLIQATQVGTSGGLNEHRKAWRQLALAGMINAGIATLDSGTTNGGAKSDTITIGLTVPASKIAGAGYLMAGYNSNGEVYGSGTNVVISQWNGTGKNSVYIGRTNAQIDTAKGFGKGAMNPADAFNLDQKVDDGSIDSSGNFTGAKTGVLRSVSDVDSGAADTACLDTTGKFYQAGTTNALQRERCVVGYQLN